MGSLNTVPLELQSQGPRTSPSPPVFIGVDVGQKRDPTALCVAQAVKLDRVYDYTIRFLERLPLGTPYPQVAARIAAVVAGVRERPRPAFQAAPRIMVLADSTGVGAPVIDLLREALRGQPVRLVAVTFTYGDKLSGGGDQLTLGKAYLVSRLQALMQSGRLHLPASHPEAAALTQELLDYEIRVDPDGDAKFGAFRVGSHDDLATALGLAALRDPAQYATVRSFA